MFNVVQPASTHEARWWERMPDGRLHCYLCPRHCHIGEGQNGFCFIRKNEGGRLMQLGYGRPAALAMDPVEKKPLNHFMPGTRILSLGTAGCNMGCQFCQNFDISKAKADHVRSAHLTPAEVVELALERGAPSLAYTYNEPTIWAEYVIDIAREAHAAGLHNVMVSNGYITREAFFEVYQHIDAANIDLKAFTEGFYGKVTLTHLQPVLDTLRWLRHETDVWFEITNLIIPTLNDDNSELKQMVEWVLENLGDDVPLHFTAFHPDFKLLDKPPTPPETLHRARKLAMDMGLKYVYEGNIFSDGGDTICPGCKRRIIRRSWHSVLSDEVEAGKCVHCGTEIPGVFNEVQVVARRGPGHLHPISR
ncbi:MAG TPA: AmmeMemoRadiSam system radical SAM enzyme [Clostridia bacterium]|nr:AmmeMemoRadiSam system radical SAM enzyme [Clostridia bacterium]